MEFFEVLGAVAAVVVPMALYAIGRRDDRLQAIEQNLKTLAERMDADVNSLSERMGKLEGVIEGFIAGMKARNP